MRPTHLIAFTLPLLVALLAPPCPAHDWPQWRGPRRDNVSNEKNLLKAWPDAGPPLLWRAKGLGIGYSSVSVSNGRVYTMGDGPDAAYVRCLDESTGDTLWSTRAGPPGGGNGYPGPRCTPTVDVNAKRLYAESQHGDLVCLELEGGKEVWRKHMKDDFKGLQIGADLRGRPIPPWGYSESPLIDGDKLICTPGGRQGTLIALNKNTGETLWRTKEWAQPATYTSPLVAEVAGRRQYIQLTGWELAAADAETGKVLWRIRRPAGPAVIPTPVYHDGHVFVTSGYGFGSNLYRIIPSGQGAATTFEVEQVYGSEELSNHLGGVVLVDGHVYGVHDPGILKCIDFKTGELKWKDRSVGKGSVAYADGHLYVRGESEEAPVALVEATPEEYREKSRFDQPDRSQRQAWPPPVIANGRLYLRDQDVLLCYDVAGKADAAAADSR